MVFTACRSPWLLRSLLFVPGDQERMIHKARQLPADAIILDLEDGVAIKDKAVARARVHQALVEGFPEGLPVFVRLNGLPSGMLEDDLYAAFHPRLDGVVLPKVRSPDEVQLVGHALATLERIRGSPVGRLVLLILIETPQAVLRAEEIVSASARIVALMFGAEDLAAEMGLTRTAAAEEVRYPRAHAAVVAHGAGCEAIDLVYSALEDQAGLVRECQEGKTLGYTGKQVIHPSQLDPVNAAFSPDPSKVAWARRVMDAYLAAPRGALVVDGRMVDAPIVAQAQRILARADRIHARLRKEAGS